MTDRQKILIVDDKDANLFALEKVLADVDAQIVRASNGNDALIAYLHHEFALAILDVQMPGMDGYELAEHLREDEETQQLPIIFLTAVYSDAHHVFKGYKAGAVDFVTKPYRSEILIAKVRIFLQLDQQRRELEKTVALEKAKNHLENILLSMTDAVLVVSKKGEIQSVNEGAAALLGYPSARMVGMPVTRFFEGPASVLERHLFASDVIATPALYTEEVNLITKKKEAIPVLISGSAFHDKDNHPLGTVIVAKDIRELIKTRKALRASEEKYRTLYETSRDGIAFSDLNGTLMDANQAFLDMIGYTLWELKELNSHQITPEIWHKKDELIFKEQILPRGYSEEYEKEYIRKDGSIFPVSARGWIFQDDDGNLAGMWMQIRDLTECRQIQQQRIITEKMTALGMMAGGIAHELNNPMMGIHGFIEYCLDHTPEEDRRYGILDDARKETKRCMDLVQSLLTFAHMDKIEEEVYRFVTFESVFDRVRRLLAYRIEKEKVKLTLLGHENCMKIHMKENAMQQVILNLMTNALDAVKESTDKEITFDVQSTKEYITLIITDTGKGILSEHMDRIFDPFFTTKAVGSGTGLGLSVSKSIVESHGGSLNCWSQPGKGTRFEVQIPISETQS